MVRRLAAIAAALAITVGCAVSAFAHDWAPKLPTTLALVIAGGGPADFKTTTLIGVLAGPNANAEVARLTKQFGAPIVKEFITTFDFVIADALRLVKAHGIALPASPDPDPTDGKALWAALYAAGVDRSTGSYNVDCMLDNLVSHPLRVQIMKDIDARYGAAVDASFRVALLQVMNDLKAAYSLEPAAPPASRRGAIPGTRTA
jgi:hypothetical protein